MLLDAHAKCKEVYNRCKQFFDGVTQQRYNGFESDWKSVQELAQGATQQYDNDEQTQIHLPELLTQEPSKEAEEKLYTEIQKGRGPT